MSWCKVADLVCTGTYINKTWILTISCSPALSPFRDAPSRAAARAAVSDPHRATAAAALPRRRAHLPRRRRRRTPRACSRRPAVDLAAAVAPHVSPPGPNREVVGRLAAGRILCFFFFVS